MGRLTKFTTAAIIAGMMYISGYMSHRIRDEPATEGNKEEIATETDTLTHHEPRDKGEAISETRTYILPRQYIKGGSGGTPRQQEASQEAQREREESDLQPSATANDGTEPGEAEYEGWQGDSITAELPIHQRHYSEEDYEAWVSGPLDARLDSIKVYRRTTTITREAMQKPKRWHIGISVGYGYTREKSGPYIGIGVTYTLYSF